MSIILSAVVAGLLIMLAQTGAFLFTYWRLKHAVAEAYYWRNQAEGYEGMWFESELENAFGNILWGKFGQKKPNPLPDNEFGEAA
jgi:hypothetical protein